MSSESPPSLLLLMPTSRGPRCVEVVQQLNMVLSDWMRFKYLHKMFGVFTVQREDKVKLINYKVIVKISKTICYDYQMIRDVFPGVEFKASFLPQLFVVFYEKALKIIRLRVLQITVPGLAYAVHRNLHSYDVPFWTEGTSQNLPIWCKKLDSSYYKVLTNTRQFKVISSPS